MVKNNLETYLRYQSELLYEKMQTEEIDLNNLYGFICAMWALGVAFSERMPQNEVREFSLMIREANPGLFVQEH